MLPLANLLTSWNKIKETIETLLGERASHALLIVVIIAGTLLSVRSIFADARLLADTGLFLCAVFGVIIAVYGVFTHQTVVGLRLQKGFIIGVIAGALAALTAGAAYYGINDAACCAPVWEAKLFRLLAASVPMGGILGALMGWLRPAGSAPLAPNAALQPTADFLSFIIGLFLLLVLCVAFFYIFDKMGTLIGDVGSPQGLIRFWHLSLILSAFAVFYVFLIVYLYGRADEPQEDQAHYPKAVSSALAAVVSTFAMFGAANLVFKNEDFQPRAQITVCTAPVSSCPECVIGQICGNDPKHANFISGILVRTMILIALVFTTYLTSTHPRSPLLRVMDRSSWLSGTSG
jgi:hypothetical protein